MFDKQEKDNTEKSHNLIAHVRARVKHTPNTNEIAQG